MEYEPFQMNAVVSSMLTTVKVVLFGGPGLL